MFSLRQCMLKPSRFSTNDVQIMVNALYVLGIKHLSCRNDRCVIVREGQFLDLKQCASGVGLVGKEHNTQFLLLLC